MLAFETGRHMQCVYTRNPSRSPGPRRRSSGDAEYPALIIWDVRTRVFAAAAAGGGPSSRWEPGLAPPSWGSAFDAAAAAVFGVTDAGGAGRRHGAADRRRILDGGLRGSCRYVSGLGRVKQRSALGYDLLHTLWCRVLSAHGGGSCQDGRGDEAQDLFTPPDALIVKFAFGGGAPR